MAAVTSAISAGVALAGLGMSVAQAAKAEKAKKSAQGAAASAASAMKNIKETNQYAQVQVPTLGFELAQQGIDRSAASALGAAQGAGAEGVIGATGQIQQAVGASELELAAQAGDLKMQRDMAQAQAGTGIEERRALRESEMLQSQITGSQLAAAQAQADKVAAISGAVGAAGSAIESLQAAGSAYKQNKSVTPSDAFKKTKKIVTPNYTGGVTGNNGTEVDMTGLNVTQW